MFTKSTGILEESMKSPTSSSRADKRVTTTVTIQLLCPHLAVTLSCPATLLKNLLSKVLAETGAKNESRSKRNSFRRKKELYRSKGQDRKPQKLEVQQRVKSNWSHDSTVASQRIVIPNDPWYSCSGCSCRQHVGEQAACGWAFDVRSHASLCFHLHIRIDFQRV